jgi:hypothetical protein
MLIDTNSIITRISEKFGTIDGKINAVMLIEHKKVKIFSIAIIVKI